jgi:DNA repair exonuclease SbcCD ATPase subunit
LQISDNILLICEDILLEKDTEIDIQEIETNIKNMENKLKKLDNFIITQENKLEKIKKIEKEINDILSQYEDKIDEDTLVENLDNIKNYYDFQIKQEKKIIDLKNILSTENFSSSLKIFSKDTNKLKNEIQELEIICGENNEILKEEELRNLITKEEINKDTNDRLIYEKNKKHEQLLKHKKNIETLKQDHINKYQKINNENDIQIEIKSKENQILDHENDINIHTINLEQINKYNKYIEDFKKYSDFKNKISEIENTEKEDRKKYNAAVLLKEKILEAESIAILNIIETINNHSQIYLDYFFIENPILVKLKSFKETKKDNKPQINIDIEYKGMETDLSSLSGGELSRVILAFTLALSEIFNCPILLLDESTASLDQDTTTIVFEAIKENFKNKIVIIVAHQVVLGIFDKIIKIS